MQSGVVAADGVFDQRDGQMWQVALSGLAAAAEVVAVAFAVTTFGFGVDQPGQSLFGQAEAALAIQHPFEVMAQNPVALPVAGPGLQDVLHAVKQRLADNCFVSATDQLAIDDDPAGVVRLGQHFMQLGVRDRLFAGPPAGRSGGQAEVSHGGLEQCDRELAGGVQLERGADERCPFLVKANAVEKATFKGFPGVEVSKHGSGGGTAVEFFVTQFGLDIFAVSADFHFVEDVDDAFHGIGYVPFAEVLLGGDEFHAYGS